MHAFKEAKVRPPEKVKVRLFIYDLIEVDITKHRFTIDFMIEIEWTDASDPSVLERKRDKLHASEHVVEDWEGMLPFTTSDNQRLSTPRLSFENSLELKTAERWVSVKWDPVDPRPTVTYKLRALGDFYERYELWAFPFDSQDLQIVLVSSFEYIDSGKVAPLKLKLKKASKVNWEKFLIRDEYAMSSKLITVSAESDPSWSASSKRYPRLSISAKITRNVGLYLWTTVSYSRPPLCKCRAPQSWQSRRRRLNAAPSRVVITTCVAGGLLLLRSSSVALLCAALE
jgi:hypothetical protein